MSVLYHDKPRSQGVENALKRAKQLIDFQWTPVKPFPCNYKLLLPDGKKQSINSFFPAWRPITGAIYSSCRFVEKYIGWNISPETFITAAENPNSVLYTHGFPNDADGGMHSYYGLVCSMFVSYVLQLPYRQACAYWTQLPTIHPVDTTELENIALCDIVLDPTRHIAIVTDILRDESGKVHRITVSESTKPLACRKDFKPEEFRKHWLESDYSVYRYDKVDEITYTPDPFAPIEGDPEMPEPFINRALMLNFGNKANYRIGDETVELSVFEDGWEGIAVTGPDGEVTTYPITDGKLALAPQTPGFYQACLVNGEKKSPSVQWCMVNLHLEFESRKLSVGEPVKLRFRNDIPEDTVFHYVLNNDTYYVKDNYYFTPEEIAAGEATAPAIQVPGKYYALIFAKNAYGIYTSHYAELIVE